MSALAVASGYADCIVLSTYEAKIARSLQEELVREEKVAHFFKERECTEMLEILNRWRKIV